MKNFSLFLLYLVMVGCSGQLAQKAKQKAPASEPDVDKSAIAVIPNPYDDDLTLENKAVEQTKQELIKRGYKLVATEADAKLIAVPTVEANVTTIVKGASGRPIDLFSDSQYAQLDRTVGVANSLSSLGQISLQGQTTSVGKANDCLVIEAFPKDAWDHALIVNELQLQPAWKIRMPLPADLKPSIEGEKIAHTGHAAETEFQLPH